MKRLTIVLLAATASLASACGPAQSGTLGPVPTGVPLPAASSPPAQTPATASAAPGQTPGTASAAPSTGSEVSSTITIETWFTYGDKIFLTHRTRPATVATSRLALTELIAGPSGLETAAGVGNAIPLDTTFSVAVSDGVATVNFSGWFYDTIAARARLRQAQVVYTLTQFPTVSRVVFQKDSQPTAAPVGRADYADLLPRIIVTSPVIGQRVTSPVTVAGMADVYESTVSMRLLDSAGKEIASTFTTAHCLPRCAFQFSYRGHGNFSTAVAYRLASEQPGTIQVYESSPEDGSRQNLVNIPVVLAASRG
jgi:Immunoglobulin-like domain of bacterial spore germination/Sporulation and spore germination